MKSLSIDVRERVERDGGADSLVRVAAPGVAERAGKGCDKALVLSARII